MSSEERRTKIKSFLSRYLRNQDVGDDEDIFALGFVNSLFAMQLVLFVEQEFDVIVENEDLEIENFASVNALLGLIERKTAVKYA
jgi:acyl carrier protein